MALHNPLDDLLQTLGVGQADPLAAPSVPGPSPTFPSAAPQQPQVSATPQRGGRLTEFIPLIAAAVAAARGGLPGYAQGLYTSTENRRKRTREDELLAKGDQRYEEAFRYRREQDADKAARDQARDERQQALDEQQRASARVSAIRDRVDAMFENNPTLQEQITLLGPEKFALKVPGLGTINFKQALDEIGAFQEPGGQYHFGEFTEPAPKPELALDYEGDVGTYVPKVAGAKVRARPRAPRAEPAPRRPGAIAADTKTLAQVSRALQAEGMDPAHAKAVLHDEEALSELLVKQPGMFEDKDSVDLMIDEIMAGKK